MAGHLTLEPEPHDQPNWALLIGRTEGFRMRLYTRFAMRVLLALDMPRRLQRLLDMNQRLPDFANSPVDLKVEQPFTVSNPEAIVIGDHVRLGPGCVFCAVKRYPGPLQRACAGERHQQVFDPTLRIGSGVIATGRLQIFVQSEVDIGAEVMFASNVFINDASHGYATAEMPYKDQPLSNILPIKIGMGSWIGQNVVILPGVNIGQLSIVGANSVVTHDVPARSIVAGSPARIIKSWDAFKQAWTPASGGFPREFFGDNKR